MLAGAAFTALLPLQARAADAPGAAGAATVRQRIDLHHHYLPNFYRAALVAAGQDHADGIHALPEWSEAGMIAMMDDLGIERAILSVVSPGVNFGDNAAARRLARQVNEEGARLAKAHPGRIGFFASTPLPDVEGAVAEVAYALDHLGASGVIFQTNFNGIYLGDARLEPVYAELDKRKAVLFLHPTSPNVSCGCGADGHNHVGEGLSLGYPAPLIEFIFETTRSVTNMVLSGMLTKYPSVQVLVPHAGAALPILASRIDVVASMQGKGPQPSMRDALKRFHFDLAGMPVPDMLSALLHVADPAKIHYGSDWPYTPVGACRALAKALDETPLLSPEMRANVMYRNAEALIGKV
ncbi:amidohydrolase family protein [Novosphingobium terrae]|uniref:amidohydrolase family protein n=1 Tax=Novosphingobium terrae TaxID=2726189 RepID=UPI001F1413C1|nr:amidohydrolase family protein [Novosphingobium terrae]